MNKKKFAHSRTRAMLIALYFLFFCITLRLFYWQVLHRSTLQAEAQGQYLRTISSDAHRGKIFTRDGYTLVDNKKVYRVFAQPAELLEPPDKIVEKIAPFLVEKIATVSAEVASDSADVQPIQVDEDIAQLKVSLLKKLSDKEIKWVALKNKIDESAKKSIEELNIHGVGFDEYEARAYPEASMAAQIVGFVGKDKDGNDKGYFGVEGELDRELRGFTKPQTFLKDALGFHLLFGKTPEDEAIDGRNVVLSIRRDVQYMVEEMLKKGMQKYGASAGEVIVMEPATGKIVAMASFPNYDPNYFYLFPPELYKNPMVSSTYEPGSTFKVLTVAAGIDQGVIEENTMCTECAGPRKIAQYTIKTWNEEYHPNITITDALAKSDNVAMIFVAEKVGQEKFVDYVQKFGIGEESHVEMQEDTPTPFRKDWKPIDLATSSFGQGIATTGLQMVRAVGAIANGGKMMQPTILDKVIDPVRGTEVDVKPTMEREVLKPETATTVTRMMVHAANSGEAKWTRSKKYDVAGKTGTAQVPIDGHYDDKKTIASFIGFSPPENPRFVMLVKLREPQSSQWASETAAPLWYQIADKLYLLMNIPTNPK
jgi:cell division protein FtsI/penicillin-binding protein 2